ncbi:MAG TPA: hypothetical protein VLB79_01460 [Solirubrobacterales bacterium]|nr:hypothetical protein [Solirubrobacterales bacterium]
MRFPVRNRDESFDLNRLTDYTREMLTGDERRVVNRIGLDLVMRHGRIERFGDALDLLATAGPQGRRELVDRARTSLGMPTIGDEQFEAQAAATNRSLRWGPDAQGRRLAACAAEGCNVWATNPNGSLRPVADRKWWCPSHKDRAGPEDHLPPEPRYVVKPSGGLKAVGEEAERLRREDEKRREEWERQQAAKDREAERLQRLEDEYRATLKPPAWMRRA